jgi:hypothetical protein
VSLRVRFLFSGERDGVTVLEALRPNGSLVLARAPGDHRPASVSKHPFWSNLPRLPMEHNPSVEIRLDTAPTTCRRLLPRCFPGQAVQLRRSARQL